MKTCSALAAVCIMLTAMVGIAAADARPPHRDWHHHHHLHHPQHHDRHWHR